MLAVACLAAAGQVACRSAASSAANPAAAGTRRGRAGDAFFGHIPADTPYVYASVAPVPRSFWRRMRPVVQAGLDAVPPPGAAAGASGRFQAALLRELRANLDEAGLRRLFGIGAQGRAAVYGIGAIPVVRVELADSKALLAAIERLQAEAGFTIPAAHSGGRSYWRIPDDQGDVTVAAVVDGQLVLSVGKSAMIDEALPLILGTRRPASSMGDGAPIMRIAARHGFPAQGFGYIDTRRSLDLAMTSLSRESTARALPPACLDELTYVAQRFPRLAFGFDELSDTRFAMRAVLETDAALAARLQQLAVDVPGLVGGLPVDRPLVAMGVGVDLATSLSLARDLADGGERLGRACGSPGAAAGMSRARAALSAPPPTWLDQIEGALFSANSVGFGPDGKPNAVEGYLIVGSDDPSQLWALVKRLGAASAMMNLAADGQFHDVFPAGAVPGLVTMRAAIKPGALVAAIGARMAETAERTLARAGRSPLSPLLYLAYDYNRLSDRMVAPKRENPLGPGATMFLSMIGMSAIWTYPTEHGLAVAFSMELR